MKESLKTAMEVVADREKETRDMDELRGWVKHQRLVNDVLKKMSKSAQKEYSQALGEYIEESIEDS